MATTTPDQIFPSSACLLQHRLDIHGCPAFDVQAVCTGFVYALGVADKFIRTGSATKALVVGAETFSRIIDWTDRGTCVIFGDGAGAVVIGPHDEPGIISSCLHADGAYRELLHVPAGMGNGGNGSPFVEMKGNEVFRVAVTTLGRIVDETLNANGDDPRRYRLAGPAPGQHAHHPGDRPQAGPADGAGRGHRRDARQHLGGVGAARLRSGGARWPHPARPNVLMEAFGGGFTWGSVLLRY
jgi:3-oxoacyl-[acyl-carrier-protein] synthase-3